jgi:hypothetical protein
MSIPETFIRRPIATSLTQGTSFFQMADYEKEVADAVARDPNVDSLMASLGGTTLGLPSPLRRGLVDGSV